MPFRKGKSGNPGGRRKDKPWTDALRLVVFRDDPDGKRRLLKIAEQCAAAAEAGDMQAIREIGDRLDGKPSQAIEATVTDDRDLEDMSDAELREYIRGEVVELGLGDPVPVATPVNDQMAPRGVRGQKSTAGPKSSA